MPHKPTYFLPKTTDAYEFEGMCRDILNIIYPDYKFDNYGGSGQEQGGIDVVSLDKKTNLYGPIVAQCKNYIKGSASRLKGVIEEDFNKVQKLKLNPDHKDIKEFIVMTAMDKNATLQDKIHELNALSVGIRADILFWEDLTEIIIENENLKNKYYSGLGNKEITVSPANITEDECIHREKEIEDIKNMLLESKNIVLLNGLGGIGKTTVAAKLYNEIKKNYDVYGWYEYNQSMENTLLEQTNLYQEAKDNRLNLILNYLNNTSQRKLICIDNVDNGYVEDELFDSITGLTNTTVIATSRLEEIESFDKYSIELLNEKQCIDLFKKYQKRIVKDETIKGFIELVSRHTLGIELIAKSLPKLMSPEDFLKQLKEKGFEFPKIKSRTKHSNKESKEIAGHLKTLFNILDKTEEEKRILYYFSIMPSINIPYDVLNWIKVDENIINDLCETGWLKNNEDSLYMHPLIKETILLDKEQFPEDLGEEFVEYACDNDIADEAESYITVLPKLEIANSLLKNINTLEGERLAIIYNKLGTLCYKQGRYEEAISYFKKLINICEKMYRKDNENTATSYNNLGLLYNEQGKYKEAEEYYKKSLVIKEKVYGKEHPYTATNYNNLGTLRYNQGKYEEAEEYYKKSLAIRKEVLGENHPYTAISHNNLGLLYDSQGKFEEAEEYYKKALVIREKVCGKDHPEITTSYNNLGELCYKQGRYKEAEEYYKKALVIREKVFGENHPYTAIIYNNLALLYGIQGKYKEAEESYKEVLAICEKRYGENHPITATSYNNLGTLCYDQGKYKEAEEYYKKSLAIREEVLEKDHPEIATIYNNLGTLYDDQGKYEEAEEYYKKSLAIRKEVLGENHPYTATTYCNLGTLYDELGNYEEAEEYLIKALVIREIVLGEDHPDTAVSYNNLGILFYNQGKYGKALDFLNKALKIRKIKLGEDHSLTITTHKTLGLLYQEINKSEK